MWGQIDSALNTIGLELNVWTVILGHFLITGLIWTASIWYHNRIQKGRGVWKVFIDGPEDGPLIISRKAYFIFLTACLIYPFGVALSFFVIIAHIIYILHVCWKIVKKLIFTDSVKRKREAIKAWMNKPVFTNDRSG